MRNAFIILATMLSSLPLMGVDGCESQAPADQAVQETPTEPAEATTEETPKEVVEEVATPAAEPVESTEPAAEEVAPAEEAVPAEPVQEFPAGE